MVTDATLLQDAVRPNGITRVMNPNAARDAKRSNRTGITFTPGRIQRFTVWHRGLVHYFCKTSDEAEKRLRAATGVA